MYKGQYFVWVDHRIDDLSNLDKCLILGSNKTVSPINSFLLGLKIDGSDKFITAGVKKMVDPVNLFLLQSTKRWIPII
jgi:hypothetical protein